MPTLQNARGVYLITPDTRDTAQLLARTLPLLPHITWLQYRNKQADAALRLAQATALRAACTAQGVPLIINDDAALAQQVGADGVHLGEDDGEVAAARALLGASAIIGVSCYDEIERARSGGGGCELCGVWGVLPHHHQGDHAPCHACVAARDRCVGIATCGDRRHHASAGAQLW